MWRWASALRGPFRSANALRHNGLPHRRSAEAFGQHLERLAQAERELAELKAGAAQSARNPLRRTVPAATSEMLAKHGIGEGPVDVRTLDAALAGLSLEQRIAVKAEMARAGMIE